MLQLHTKEKNCALFRKIEVLNEMRLNVHERSAWTLQHIAQELRDLTVYSVSDITLSISN